MTSVACHFSIKVKHHEKITIRSMRIETRPGKSRNGSVPIDGEYFPKINSPQNLGVHSNHITCNKSSNKIKT